MATSVKDLQRIRNTQSRAKGKQFEEKLDEAFDLCRETGAADIEKTPEPMKPIKSLGQGRFVACYTQAAQADYQGVLRGGRSAVFEAKYTDSDRMARDRVTADQEEYIERKHQLGALAAVIIGFHSNRVYAIPWPVWRDMKQHFGHKYVTEDEVKRYEVPKTRSGKLLILK